MKLPVIVTSSPGLTNMHRRVILRSVQATEGIPCSDTSWPMRRDTSKPDVPWTIRVPASEKQELYALLPMNGARTWLFTTGLEKFLDLMESAPPEKLRWAHADLQRALYPAEGEPRANTAEIALRIPTALYNRFNALFPEYGATTWFARRFLRHLIVELQEGLTLEQLVETAVNKAMREESNGEA